MSDVVNNVVCLFTLSSNTGPYSGVQTCVYRRGVHGGHTLVYRHVVLCYLVPLFIEKSGFRFLLSLYCTFSLYDMSGSRYAFRQRFSHVHFYLNCIILHTYHLLRHREQIPADFNRLYGPRHTLVKYAGDERSIVLQSRKAVSAYL